MCAYMMHAYTHVRPKTLNCNISYFNIRNIYLLLILNYIFTINSQASFSLNVFFNGSCSCIEVIRNVFVVLLTYAILSSENRKAYLY